MAGDASGRPKGSLGATPARDFESLRSIALGLGLGTLASSIEQTANAISRGHLKVAVLGQFKRGKSTLLNAIAAREFLPSGLLPVTAVPIAIHDGVGEAKITLSDGSSTSVRLEAIGQYVTQLRNPGNRLGVSSVDVGVPLPDWAREVTFVDTPGIGSVVAENTATSRALLPEVDGAIFVFSPDPPLTDNERIFLADAAEHATKFFFILNKVDLLTAAELRELLQYTETLLREQCGFSSPRIFPVSAREALRRSRPGAHDGPDLSGLPAFLEELNHYLVDDRIRSVEDVRRRRIVLYARRLKEVIELSLRSSRLSDRIFSQKSRGLELGLAEFELERRASDALLDDAVRTAFEARDLCLSTFREAMTPSVARTMEEFVRDMHGLSGGQIARKFDERFRAELTPLVATLRAARVRDLSEAMAMAFRQYQERLQRSLEAFEQIAAGLFDIQRTPIIADVPLSDAVRYSSAIEPLYEGTMAGQTLLILPGAILRRSLRARVRRIVEEELDAQCGRIRSNLTERTEQSVHEFRRRTRIQFETDSEGLRVALEAGRLRHEMNAMNARKWEETREQWLTVLDQMERVGVPETP